jgi:chromosome segregation ATPase
MMDEMFGGESVQIKWLSRRLELEVARRSDAEAKMISECSDIEYIREQFTLAVADWSKQQRVSENRLTAAETVAGLLKREASYLRQQLSHSQTALKDTKATEFKIKQRFLKLRYEKDNLSEEYNELNEAHDGLEERLRKGSYKEHRLRADTEKLGEALAEKTEEQLDTQFIMMNELSQVSQLFQTSQGFHLCRTIVLEIVIDSLDAAFRRNS